MRRERARQIQYGHRPLVEPQARMGCARWAASTSPSAAEMIEPFIRMCQDRHR
jgi:hypothetical protein